MNAPAETPTDLSTMYTSIGRMDCVMYALDAYYTFSYLQRQAAVTKKYMDGVLYGGIAREVYPDQDELRPMFETVAAEHLQIPLQEAFALMDQKLPFPVLRRVSDYAQTELHKKLRDAVHKLMDKFKQVATAAFLDKYHTITGAGHFIRDKNDNQVLVFSANDEHKCVWEEAFLKKESGKTSMRAAIHATCG